MKHSLAFVLLLTGLLIAQVVSDPQSGTKSDAKTTQQEKDKETPNTSNPTSEDSSDEADSNEEENLEADHTDTEEDVEDDDADDDESDEQLPTLACAIFHNIEVSACDVMCSMIGSIYGYPVTPGTCDNDVYCQCSIDPDATLDQLWNTRFNAKSVLKEILDSENLSRKVVKILRKPMKTREQTLQTLQSILSPEQLQRIKIKDTIGQKIFLADGKFDKNAVKKYVARKIAPVQEQLNDGTYKGLLYNILRYHEEDTKQYIMREIRRSANKTLNTALDELIKRYKIRESAFEDNDQETLVDILDTTILNQVYAQTNSRENRKSVIKKSSGRPKPSTSGKNQQ